MPSRTSDSGAVEGTLLDWCPVLRMMRQISRTMSSIKASSCVHKATGERFLTIVGQGPSQGGGEEIIEWVSRVSRKSDANGSVDPTRRR